MVPRVTVQRISRRILGGIVLLLVVSSGALVLAYDPPSLEAGPIKSPANGTTVVATQGWNAGGHSLSSRPAILAAVDANGTVNWTHDGPPDRRSWFYDVDPLPGGNLLVVNPIPGETVVYEFDPDSGERLWTERFDRPDIHDVDLINDDELLVAGISYDGDRISEDSVFVYNRTQEAVTWEWSFSAHYPDDIGKGIKANDWTHVNDVDRIEEGRFLVSVRNFDQVIVVNRTTKAIELRLGEDGDHNTLYEQHNPQYLESEQGTPTILVPDSENSRVLEYERNEDGEWERVWTLTGDLNWPRDADRLPNGNTLIVDSMNHRVIEVRPDGEVVWEMSVPWAPYDAERIAHGEESGGPTIRDQGAAGTYELRGGSTPGVAGLPPIHIAIAGLMPSSQLLEPFHWTIQRWYHIAPWFTPLWMPTWSASLLVPALALLLGMTIKTRILPRVLAVHRRMRKSSQVR